MVAVLNALPSAEVPSQRKVGAQVTPVFREREGEVTDGMVRHTSIDGMGRDVIRWKKIHDRNVRCLLPRHFFRARLATPNDVLKRKNITSIY